MNVIIRIFLIQLFLIIGTINSSFSKVQEKNENKEVKDFQIHLSQPAKSIRLIMYENDFTPIQGKLSDDRKSIIIKNYKAGSKVRVKVEYDDGTIDEFVRSPCYIDPVAGVNAAFNNFPMGMKIYALSPTSLYRFRIEF